MAKLRGAARVAFLRRMARGRAKARRSSGVARARTTGKRRTARRAVRSKGYSGTIYRSRKHAGVVRFRVRRNPLQALIANPGELVPYGYKFPARKRRKKGATSMAKRRKRRSGRRRVRRASPRRRTYRRRPVHRRRARRRAHARRSGVARVRRGTRVIYINPRGRRRRGHRVRRRRNPGFGGLLRMAFVPYATGVVTSAAMAMLDSGLAQWPMVGNIVKAGGALGIAAFFGRVTRWRLRRPSAPSAPRRATRWRPSSRAACSRTRPLRPSRASAR